MEEDIEELEEIKETIDSLTNIEDKLLAFEEIRNVLSSLTESDLKQIEDNIEYKEYIDLLNFEYQKLLTEVNIQVEVAQKIANIVKIIPVLLSLATYAYIKFSRKRGI